MARADDGLPFLQQYENVAWYEDGEVIILDRRVYPTDIQYVRCGTPAEVAQANAAMVTQSGGPWWAAALGIVCAAKSVRDLDPNEAIEKVRTAANTLASARATTSTRMRDYLQSIVEVTERAILNGDDAEAATLIYVKEMREKRYQQSRQVAQHTVELLPDNATILTQCYAETYIGMTLLVSKELGKNISLITPETRPYLQGARLTASVAHDLGIPVTVITDNMPGFILSQGKADVFISAADVLTMDGHVVNKIGTFQIALAAHFFGIPYYVQAVPSTSNPTIDSVEIEERDPEEVVHFGEYRTTKEGVGGYYPAFDITPPQLVSAVVNYKGVFSPYALERFFEAGTD